MRSYARLLIQLETHTDRYLAVSPLFGIGVTAFRAPVGPWQDWAAQKARGRRRGSTLRKEVERTPTRTADQTTVRLAHQPPRFWVFGARARTEAPRAVGAAHYYRRAGRELSPEST